MTRFLSLVAAGLLTTGAATAQVTSQEAVLGNTGDPVYSLQVRGANNVVYNCMPEIVSVDGVRARKCVPAGQGGLFDAGNGVAAAGAVAAGLVLIAVLAGDDDDNVSTTTTTN